MRILIILSLGLIFAQILFGQSNLSPKQIEKANYLEVHGFSDFENDTLKPDKFPMYPNGQDGLIKDVSKSIKYPAAARKEGIQGKVILAFIVEKNGTIEKTEIIESANPDLDAEAIRVIKNLKTWLPGMKNGEPVSVPFVYPITFQLN